MTNAERQKRYREHKRNAQTVTESPESVTVGAERNVTPLPLGDIRLLADKACLDHYLAEQDKYAPRANPDKLNWGPWLNTAELNAAGLKANRVPIPGDWDYEGSHEAI